MELAGLYSRDGLLQIVEVAEHIGSLTITVRELIGGPTWGWMQSKPTVRERARKFALRSTGGVATRTVREGYGSGSFTWTFDVTL